ncbi:hypothetical protein [Haladaptatus salinisoli]|uniref:hypothetical protein n=1 Tax=Haladaptatus salinisoli TaxID=2884876 RepID=UPI001D09EFCD|nr:hypothetical protein [Haladaptatus salinisoli]
MSTEEDQGDSEKPRHEPSDAYFHELQSIQAIIERQANNSSKIKGWTITLVVAVILFRTGNYQTLFGFVPLVAFWSLDSYYLKQERNYRELHKWVRIERLESDDQFFNMDASRFSEKTDSIGKIMFSSTQMMFYGVIAALLLVFFVYPVFFSKNGTDLAATICNNSTK